MGAVNYALDITSEFMSDFAERIKIARQHAGYNGPEMAKLLKVSKSSIYNWEKAEAIPSAISIFDIEDATGVRASWIVRGKGPKFVSDPEETAPVDIKSMPAEERLALLTDLLDFQRGR